MTDVMYLSIATVPGSTATCPLGRVIAFAAVVAAVSASQNLNLEGLAGSAPSGRTSAPERRLSASTRAT
ncbi:MULTISPECIES: hypothetical protein [unclassified Chelatococcus]|uniref:hypothetical protein n=1 Tax=unclassified Chelatococcus TaxID=2638111 RepID=UPI001BCC40BC|nr:MULTISPECIES: hypothetical protein [unclassified Chelatococcus]MBS7700766.1 hypothetical protein [Chelatococcus sp. YT9]MBX3559350.1 hypothetical protein [Chelatococcus sp.]